MNLLSSEKGDCYFCEQIEPYGLYKVKLNEQQQQPMTWLCPSPAESTGFCQITQVKQQWTCFVLKWVTAIPVGYTKITT